ncbi:MAG: DUF805 domain-containing protein [Actinomycetia bacterium]|nr:DUF805 domain-containing protein [Actinomycetes bacterium]
MENIDWQDLLFKFSGRINRAKFWIGLGVTWAIMVLAMMIAGALGNAIGWILLLIAYVAVVWIGIAVSIKRWHDRGKPGWWIFIGLIPLVGPIWALVETGFLEGTKGDNEYGPDPLAGA